MSENGRRLAVNAAAAAPGPRRLVIADDSCVGASTAEAFEACGLVGVARRCGAELVDFTDCEHVHVLNPLAASFVNVMGRRGGLEALRDTVFLYGMGVEELPAERMAGKRVVRVGSCTRKLDGYGHYLPGCPPYPYHMLKDLGLG